MSYCKNIYLVCYRTLSLQFPIYIRIAKINIKLSQISSTKHDHYMTSDFRVQNLPCFARDVLSVLSPNEVPSELTTHHYLTRIIVTFFNWSLLPSIGTPTTQVHDFPKRLLWLLHFLISQFVWNHCRSWRRKALGLSIRPQIVLGMLLCRSYDKIPPTDPLVFHGFHNSNTHCHNSFSCWTHFPFSQDCCLFLQLVAKNCKLYVANNNDLRRICVWCIKWNGGDHLYREMGIW